MRPLKVLYCVGTLNAGGLERFVTRLSIHARSGNEIEPVVLCLHRRNGLFLEVLERSGITVLESPPSWMYRPNRFLELAKVIRSVAPDIVHTQVNFSMLQQFLAARLAGVRVFCITERNMYPLVRWGRLRRILQYHLLRLLGAHYTANGEQVARYLEDMVNIESHSISVLPNAVDLIASDAATRQRLRSQHAWDEDAVVVGYVSRFARHKGHIRFLNAIAQLKHEGYSVYACLVGDGPQRAKIQNSINELGIQDRVVLTGLVSNVEDYLQAFDIVSLLSDHEGMPNALLEAMAAGKPVMATSVGSVPELLDNGKVGVLVDLGKEGDEVSRLRYLILNESERDELGKLGLARIKEIYSIEMIFRLFVNYYAKISSRRES